MLPRSNDRAVQQVRLQSKFDGMTCEQADRIYGATGIHQDPCGLAILFRLLPERIRRTVAGAQSPRSSRGFLGVPTGVPAAAFRMRISIMAGTCSDCRRRL